MRWPRWLRRRTEAATTADSSGESTAIVSGVQRAPATPAARRDWASLAPLRPVAGGAPPPSGDHRAFTSGLTGHQAVYRAIGPLSHDVRLDAPHGIASGITAPPEPIQSNDAELPLRATELPAAPSASVQRSPLPASRPASVRPASTSPLPVQRAELPAPAVTRQVSAAELPAPAAPIMRAPDTSPRSVDAGTTTRPTVGAAFPLVTGPSPALSDASSPAAPATQRAPLPERSLAD